MERCRLLICGISIIGCIFKLAGRVELCRIDLQEISEISANTAC